MQVLKFGGTSVGTPENIQIVKEIVFEKAQKDQVIVVVSAFRGITSRLIDCGKLAASGNSDYEQLLIEIKKQHLQTAKKLLSGDPQSALNTRLKSLLNELEDILRGVFLIKEVSVQTMDRISCFGEVLSAEIISTYFRQSEESTSLLNPKDFIKTDSLFGRANVNFNLTNQLIAENISNSFKIRVCPGFLAADASGRTTTLGRGGSDYTAAILAAALNAPQLEIWTDVSGMMTANPSYVKNAYAIEEIGYDEAMELTHFGAKVLYPPSIQPVLKKGIPILIKNTLKKEDKGTRISESTTKNDEPIKGLSCIEDIALLNLNGSGMVGIPYFSHRLFETLSDAKVSVILITQASSEHSICVAISQEDVEVAKAAVKEHFQHELSQQYINPLEVEKDLSIVALVGANMKNQIGTSGKMLSILGSNGVNIKAIAQGSSEKNISVVIEKKQIKKSLNALHESFFLSDNKRVNLFIVGTGNVGKALLQQLKKQQTFLNEKHHIDLRITGIANSKKMYFDEEGLDINKPMDKLLSSEKTMHIDSFIDEMVSMNLRNSIFIDNTAHEVIANTYQKILANTISVVTPNKIACTGPFAQYKKLKNTALRYKSNFLFETNVGAGLPIINTLNDLIKSGDEILEIEAVLSGSLNFIFNNYDGQSKSFAEIIAQAKEEGYTEPDPRLDLSGSDVMRKILILLRESGLETEMKDIESVPFIPKECMDASSVEEFFKLVEAHEAHFKQMINEAKEAGKKLKYVASFKDGKAQTGLQQIAPGTPLYNLEGKDNIVLFTTKRYPDQPLVVKGAGAGAEVTASGIFGDIMRIANTF